MRVVFSPAAQADLLEYIAVDSPSRALSFTDTLEQASRQLVESPHIGMRPELGEGVRSIPHGSYLIFYRVLAPNLRIERILHGARDIGTDSL